MRGVVREEDALLLSPVVKHLDHLLDAAVRSQVVAADSDPDRVILERRRELAY